jgi:hypothetical protein
LQNKKLENNLELLSIKNGGQLQMKEPVIDVKPYMERKFL